MKIKELIYSVVIYDFNNNESFKSEVRIPVELPKDIEIVKNPEMMFNQIRQEYQINRPDWSVKGVRIEVYFIGDQLG